MSSPSSEYPPCSSYGDAPPALPLEEIQGLDGVSCNNESNGTCADRSADVVTRRSSNVNDCYVNYDYYTTDQTPYVDRTTCKNFEECFVDTETVDTAVDTTSLPETDFPTDPFDFYTNHGNSMNAMSAMRGGPSVSGDTTYEHGRPIIRLKSLADAQARAENYAPYNGANNGYAWPPKQVYQGSIPPGSYDSPHNLDDFMRSSGQLYHPVDKMPHRCDSYSAPAFTPPSVPSCMDQSGCRTYGPSSSMPLTHSVDPISDDSDFLTPRLTTSATGPYRKFQPTSNYCVYVGSETNKLNCGCNMSRPSGGNCHVSGCPLVTSELEPSTEQWPVSGSSHLQSLVRRLHCVVERFKTSSSSVDEKVSYQPVAPPRMWPMDSRPINPSSFETLGPNSFDFSKRHCSITSEYHTAREENPAPEYYVQTSYEDSPYDSSLTGDIDQSLLQRKPHCNGNTEYSRENDVPSRNEFGRFISALTTSPASTPDGRTHYTTPKQSKKKSAPATTHTGEKVSGVWYDANRHLWRVVYMKGNKRKTQGFSSIKLGYEEARRKAIEMRHEMVALRRTDKI
ncbi:AP2 domain transcription factor AP2VIII-6 [Babesia ovis]|uniref:AP2 domain transcription factor AP2VIII-6 n=1 Tax=Babesia ovis TaxID=5869 RepID=A0A9W5WU53_BABOV|nr:AP2 domain transcription factor AP2VIII-6 [Babesia ovis]